MQLSNKGQMFPARIYFTVAAQNTFDQRCACTGHAYDKNRGFAFKTLGANI